jgi:hypothetical protein
LCFFLLCYGYVPGLYDSLPIYSRTQKKAPALAEPKAGVQSICWAD